MGANVDVSDGLLFPVVETLSPRLLWMKKHAVLSWFDTGKRDGFQVCPPQWFAGFQHWWPEKTGIDFFANETGANGDSRIGEGDSEHEALANLMTCWDARKVNMKLWNEEAGS